MKCWQKVFLILWLLIFTATSSSLAQVPPQEVKKYSKVDSIMNQKASKFDENGFIKKDYLLKGGIAGTVSGYTTKQILSIYSNNLPVNSNIKPVIIFPDSDQDFKEIFGFEITTSKKNEITQIRNLVEKSEIHSVKTVEELENFINDNKNYPINIIGHSEKMGHGSNSKLRGYKLVDGKISIQDLDSKNSRITHLSCLSGDCSLNPGLPKKISYREGLELNNYLKTSAIKVGTSSLDTSLPKGFLKEAIKKSNFNNYFPRTVGIAIGISTSILPIFDYSKENVKPTSKSEIDKKIEKLIDSKKIPEKGN
ncbi:hypothetical protein [Algoriphagus formosus]|uniref:hypothetical protein n=1 Tax=Algoriphagus formosus TaxID=2007308 RepID=UPI000C28ACB3|nr:hypothetical protein [Algoriphagus formosus]